MGTRWKLLLNLNNFFFYCPIGMKFEREIDNICSTLYNEDRKLYTVYYANKLNAKI